MKNTIIDINADLGEGLGNESELMPYLSSCNIACGGHAGDAVSMSNVVRLAKTYGVKIGVHPSFPDKKNFGRQVIDMPTSELNTILKHQIRGFLNVLHNEKAILHHLKPHGALYNLAAKDEKTASVIIEVIKSIALPIKLYAPYNSVIANLALIENIEVVYEAFADRNYNEDLSLVSRSKTDALIIEKDCVFKHVFQMLNKQLVKTKNGVEVSIKASTFCVHGDTENAIEILRYLIKKLNENNIVIH